MFGRLTRRAQPHMQTDEDSLTTLSKWPFIFGDLLLVATALAIAILGDWQLSNWQVASCVISVALGASLFVLPYVVEFQVRLREEREDRGAKLRILHKHVVNAREEVDAAGERIKAIEVALNETDRSKPDLSGPIEALEKKINMKLEPVGGQHLLLAEEISAVSKQVDELSAKLKNKLDAKLLKVVEAELSSLKNELSELPAKLPSPSEQKVITTEEAQLVEASSKKIERTNRSPLERREQEPRLLKRAIDQKQDKSSAAVSRIIESKQKDKSPKESPKKPISEPEEKSQPQPESKPVEKKPVASVDEEVLKVAKPKEILEKPPVMESAPKDETSKPLANKETPKPAKERKKEVHGAEKPPVPEKPERKGSPAEVETPVDMFGQAVPTQVKKRSSTKKSDTAVTASVFIGIGNKPYLRGSGGGLNWDIGVEMEFEEIGRWRWIAPADLEGSIEIQLYRNDEDADSTGKYTLEPGQQLDLSPVF